VNFPKTEGQILLIFATKSPPEKKRIQLAEAIKDVFTVFLPEMFFRKCFTMADNPIVLQWQIQFGNGYHFSYVTRTDIIMATEDRDY
jgi:hypothetical protein